MGTDDEPGAGRGKWLALTAALLGWLFDGFEMGLFPVISRPALIELLGFVGQDMTPERESQVGLWNSLAIAGFLVGAATGGVLFGWLGDRLGRVRAMALSILTYALCSGLGGFVVAPWQIVLVRFVAALGMGGEWSLGVALVMEVWGGRSRAVLAGLIGAAANFGYLLVALLSLGLGSFRSLLVGWGLSGSWVEWRLLMVLGTLPALLTFFVRIFVPESGGWEEERSRGRTSAWSGRDLVGVLLGAWGCWVILMLWSQPVSWGLRVNGTLFALVGVTLGFLYPAFRYLGRSGGPPGFAGATLRTMLLAAALSGVPLLATWASIQWGPTWGDQLSGGKLPAAKALTQICSALGAIVGCVLGALLAGWKGRRLAYVVLCLTSLGSCWLFFQTNDTFGAWFLFTAGLAGACTAAFYGWLPLYLPELFPTRVRATGQGFGYNFGRILAAVGALQTGSLMGLFQKDVVIGGQTFTHGYPLACTAMSLIYLVGVALIWLAPETRGKPLPE